MLGCHCHQCAGNGDPLSGDTVMSATILHLAVPLPLLRAQVTAPAVPHTAAAVQFRCRRLSLAPVLHRTGLLAVLSPGHSCFWPLLPAPGLQSTSLGAHRARIPISSLRAYQQGQLKCSMPQAPTLPLQPGTPASLPVSLFSKANVNFPPIMGPSLPPSLSPVLDRAHLEQLPFPRVSLGHRDVPPGW